MAMQPMMIEVTVRMRELHHLGNDHADHAALDGIEGGQHEEDDRVDVLVGEQALRWRR